jgi:NADPH2:quinone reductase
MRAAYYERTGLARDVLTIGEVPTPQPGPGEVRVRIATSGVNPSDVKSRRGLVNNKLAFPRIIPHSDGAGTIDAVGAEVDAARIGERVWIWNGAWQRPFGTAAEWIVVPSAQAVCLPDAVDFAAGACLGIPALTAYHAVMMDGGVAGKDVLIAGGAGAVGHYAIQFAKRAGAKSIAATISSPEKAALARDAGADLTINYKEEDAAARLASGVDRIIEVDLAANIALDLAVVRPEGDIVVYGSGQRDIPVPFGPSIMKNIRYRFFIVYNLNAADRARAIADVTSMLAAGQLQHNIAARLPLDRIADAHELVESGTAHGNVVVEV